MTDGAYERVSGALANVTAERDEARRERDEARLSLARFQIGIGGALGEVRPGDTDMVGSVHSRLAALDALRAERDAALAKLAEIEAACRPLIDETVGVEVTEEHYAAVRSALSLAPSTALAERDARVRAEALKEADQRPEGASVDALRAVLASRGGG